jgi:hypothetical protein
MKTIKQLLSELPSKSLIFAFGRFNPPTIGHELLISKVEALSKKTSIPYRIYATATQDKKSNPLSQKDKIKYMEKSFRNAHIYAAKGNIIQLLQSFEREGIKEIHLVVGSDRTKEFETLLNKYNGKDYKFNKIEIHSAGERDPDSDDADGMSASKMRSAANDGDYKSFAKGVTKKLTDVYAKKMYNDVRKGLGLKTESFEINISNNSNELREKYFKGEILNIGTTVQDEKGVYEIMDRGTNYITVINENGELSKKWLDSVKEVITDMKFNETKIENQVSFKGFTTKNFEVVKELKPIIESIIASEKDSIAIINTLKSLDESLGYYKQNKDLFKIPLLKGVDALKNIDHAVSGMVADMILKLPRQNMEITEANMINYTGADKIKVARILAGAFGVDSPEKMSSPEQLVNTGLRLMRTKRITPELKGVISSMLSTADMLGIKYDKSLIPTAMKQDKDTVEESKAERIASMRSRMSDLVSKLGEVKPTDADAKTKMAIIKSDINTLRLRINDLTSKKEDIEVLDPAGIAAVIDDPLSPAVMPSFIKFGESTCEVNEEICETAQAGLEAKAKKSGVPLSILRKVYNRGMAAWKTGHRPGTTPQQWAMARVNSYITKGKTYHTADKDLREEDDTLIKEEPRIPRKDGQPANSKKHSDLYTDENPKGTIHGLKFATVEDAEESVIKIKNSDRSHAHKIQAAVAMEQRARVMGKVSAAAVYRKFINSMKKDEEVLANEERKTTPKDKETGLPKKYVSGLSDKTAQKRADHFEKMSKKSDKDPEAYKPAPGDKDAKTKVSKHTQKYRDMFGEDMDEEVFEACWDGYKQIGFKKKNGKQVPNCVPESNKVESVLNLIRRIREQKKTMLVARPNNLMKPGQEKVLRIPVSKWPDYRKRGFIQAEEKENKVE